MQCFAIFPWNGCREAAHRANDFAACGFVPRGSGAGGASCAAGSGVGAASAASLSPGLRSRDRRTLVVCMAVSLVLHAALAWLSITVLGPRLFAGAAPHPDDPALELSVTLEAPMVEVSAVPPELLQSPAAAEPANLVVERSVAPLVPAVPPPPEAPPPSPSLAESRESMAVAPPPPRLDPASPRPATALPAIGGAAMPRVAILPVDILPGTSGGSGSSANLSATDIEGDVRPAYPKGSRVRGEEGTVKLGVRLHADGRVMGVEVARSSGHDSLDQAALSAMEKARFTAKKGSIEENSLVLLSIRFQLTDAEDSAGR